MPKISLKKQRPKTRPKARKPRAASTVGWKRATPPNAGKHEKNKWPW